MKKTTKRLLTLMLTVVMIVMILPVNTLAATKGKNYDKKYARHNLPGANRVIKFKRPNTYGDDVKWIQCVINKLIIDGDKNGKKLKANKLEVDGYYGTETEKAVKAFQSAYSLKYVDGIFGKETRAKMMNVLNIKEPGSYIPSGVTKKTYILLCNCVAMEAGSDEISVYDKALVVEVIKNRVASNKYPNTIKEVIGQKGQFSNSSSYINLTTYSSRVTPNVKAAVTYYYEHRSEFNHGYLYFTGDGHQNHFRVK